MIDTGIGNLFATCAYLPHTNYYSSDLRRSTQPQKSILPFIHPFIHFGLILCNPSRLNKTPPPLIEQSATCNVEWNVIIRAKLQRNHLLPHPFPSTSPVLHLSSPPGRVEKEREREKKRARAKKVWLSNTDAGGFWVQDDGYMQAT